MVPYLRQQGDAVEVRVLVQPRASRTRIVGEHDGRLKIQLTSPPVDGEANAELVAWLAKRLGLSKREVTIASGETGRRKVLQLRGIELEAAARLLSSESS